MNRYIDFQVIEAADGFPAFVLVSYDECIRCFEAENELAPNAAVHPCAAGRIQIFPSIDQTQKSPV